MLETFFTIGAWLGFSLFVVCFLIGAFVVYQAITLAMVIAFARWKWRKVRKHLNDPAYTWEIAKLMEKEIEKEEAKEQSSPETNTNTNQNTTNDTSRTAGNQTGKIPTPRKM